MHDDARAIARASMLALDPSRAVVRALVDDPLFADWAAPEALRLLGAPHTPAELAGRLIVVAMGLEAERMAFGASAVFGEAVDELLVRDGVSEIDIPSETDRALETLVGALGRQDRLLLLHSPPGRPESSHLAPGTPSRGASIDDLAAWAAPARVVCLSLVGSGDARSSFGADNLEFRVIETGGAGTSAALAEARVRGLDTTLLTSDLKGDPASVGRALARVGQAIQAGLGGLAPPACAIAAGLVRGGGQRHGKVIAAALETLDPESDRVTVECWSPGPRAPDLFAVLVAPEG